MSDGKVCKCGHSQSDHIYDEDACRPGFICSQHCEKFEAATATVTNEENL